MFAKPLPGKYGSGSTAIAWLIPVLFVICTSDQQFMMRSNMYRELFKILAQIGMSVFFFVSACSPAAGDGTVSKGKTADTVAAVVADSLPLTGKALENMYALAVADFITAVQQRTGTTYDTLFFGKRKFGQPDDFPDIELPEKIGQTTLQLVAPAEGEKLQQAIKTRVYINLIGWTTQTKADFVFVVFSNGFAHQYDCNLSYTFSKTAGRFERTGQQFVIPGADGR